MRVGGYCWVLWEWVVLYTYYSTYKHKLSFFSFLSLASLVLFFTMQLSFSWNSEPHQDREQLKSLVISIIYLLVKPNYWTAATSPLKKAGERHTPCWGNSLQHVTECIKRPLVLSQPSSSAQSFPVWPLDTYVPKPTGISLPCPHGSS